MLKLNRTGFACVYSVSSISHDSHDKCVLILLSAGATVLLVWMRVYARTRLGFSTNRNPY